MVVTVDESGAVREEPMPSKVRELKQELRQKRMLQVNERKSDKELLLKEIRERKNKGQEIGDGVRDQLWKKIIEKEVAHDMVNKPMMELLKHKFVWNKI